MRSRAAVAVALPALLTAVLSGARPGAGGPAVAVHRPAIDPIAARLAANRFGESELGHRPAAEVGFLGQTASRAAVEQRDALAAQAATVAGTGGTWRQYGTAPVLNNTSDYQPVDAIPTFTGRVADFADDPATGRLWVAVGVSG